MSLTAHNDPLRPKGVELAAWLTDVSGFTALRMLYPGKRIASAYFGSDGLPMLFVAVDAKQGSDGVWTYAAVVAAPYVDGAADEACESYSPADCETPDDALISAVQWVLGSTRIRPEDRANLETMAERLKTEAPK